MGKLSSLMERVKNMSFKRMFMNVREVKKKSKRGRIGIFIDMVWCAFHYGVGYLDYNVFGFAFVRGKKKRRTYMTMNHNMLLTGKVNDPAFVHLFQDKIEFNKTFDKFLGRRWIDLRETSRKQFKKFLKRKPNYFAKVIDDCGGNGVEKLSMGRTINYKKTYDTLKEKKQFLVEDALVQHPTMNRLCPTSINTLRITTVLKNNEPHIMYCLVRMGDGTKAVDNISSGGMYCPVNEKGLITAPAFCDKDGQLYDRHPMTMERFVNFRIPLYRDAVKLVKRAAKVVPQMGYIGWDIAITEDGPAIVEGNTVPSYDMCQNYEHIGDQGGILPKFEEYFGKGFNLVGRDAATEEN